jgi:hypothetical protein
MSYRGVEAPIELAKFGLVGSRNLAAIPPSALLEANNVALDSGAITRVGGSTKYNSLAITNISYLQLEESLFRYRLEDDSGYYLLEHSGSGSAVPRKIRGLFDWWPTSVLQRLIVFTDGGEVLRDAGGVGSFTTMKLGLNILGNPVFAVGGNEDQANNKKLFLTTGLDTVQVVDGDATMTRDINTGVAGAPDDWTGTTQPKSLFNHNGRMWGVSGHNLYGSTVTDHEDFKSAGSVIIPVETGVSSFLQGGMSFKGRLFLFKWPLGIYWLDDSSTTQANWFMKRLTKSAGMAGPNAITLVDDDVLFMSEIGHIHMLSGVNEFGDVKNSDLMALNELTPWVRENLNTSQAALERVQAIYYPDRKEAMFSCRSTVSTINDLKIVVDLNRKDTPRIRIEDKDVVEALAVREDTNRVLRPISGDDDGFIWLQDQATKDVGGVGYISEFQVPHTDFAWFNEKLATVRKNFSFLEVVMQPTGNFTLFIDVLQDGDYKETLLFSTGGSGAALGSFILGTDELAGDSIVNTRKRLRGSARRLSLIGRQSNPDEDFSISQMFVGFTPGGMRT